MIAFDSNVLIYFLENDAAHGLKAEGVFREIENRGGVCSALAITETMYGTIDAYHKITPLLSPKVNVVQVSKSLAALAGQLKIKHGLKNIDAIHLATALLSEADEFVTNDQALLKKTLIGIKIRGL